MHKFGWACEFQCGFGNLVASCTGSQFGLPDPYGSSCISGYSGRDCNTGKNPTFSIVTQAVSLVSNMLNADVSNNQALYN